MDVKDDTNAGLRAELAGDGTGRTPKSDAPAALLERIMGRVQRLPRRTRPGKPGVSVPSPVGPAPLYGDIPTPESLPSEGCWHWLGATAGTERNKYGVIMVRGRLKSVRRLLFSLLRPGEGIGGRQLCGACTTPGCVNPAHLRLGQSKGGRRGDG